MESRTRLAISGMTAVAASVGVICAVALTNSVSLSEAQGAPVGATAVVVPSAAEKAEPVATPTIVPTPVQTPQPVETQTPVTPPVAEVVPAPEAEDVTPVQSSHVAETPATPTPSAPGQEDAVAEAEASGSWAPAREWAKRLGWSQARIDAWIARLEKDRDSGNGHGNDRDWGDGSGDGRDSGDGRAGSERRSSTTDTTRNRSDQTGSTKERPANAGASAGDRSTKPGLGTKKDRSRGFSDRRD